jgi:LysM repeat protein
MKNPNPIIPPGMNLEKSRRGRSNMRIAVVVIVLVHVALFAGILFNACSQKEDDAAANPPPEENNINTVTALDIPAPSGGGMDISSLPTAGGGSDMGNPIGGIEPLPLAGGGIEPLPPAGGGTGGLGSLTPAAGAGGASGAFATPSISGTEHTILSGDNYTTIAKKYGVSINAVKDANPSLDPRRLQIGHKVNIPTVTTAPPSIGSGSGTTLALAANEYVIKRGDSLSTIAQRHGTSVKALRAANNLKTDLILAGEKLKLPAGAGARIPAPSAGSGSSLPPPPGTE